MEFYKDAGYSFVKNLPVDDAEVLILAGDSVVDYKDYFNEAFEILCSKFKYVIRVLGNHDYYQGVSPQETLNSAKELQNKFSNLFVLENESVTLPDENKNITFHGTTLWFSETPESAFYKIGLNDFRKIKTDYRWFYKKHEDAVIFLDKNVREGDVVITHHLPSYGCISEKWVGDPMNCFYASNLNSLIERLKPSFWFHGHSHESFDQVIYDTRFIRNPAGYVVERNLRFNPNLIIEV